MLNFSSWTNYKQDFVNVTQLEWADMDVTILKENGERS